MHRPLTSCSSGIPGLPGYQICSHDGLDGPKDQQRLLLQCRYWIPYMSTTAERAPSQTKGFTRADVNSHASPTLWIADCRKSVCQGLEIKDLST